MKARPLSLPVICGLFLVLSGCATVNERLELALPGYTMGLKSELPPEGGFKDWCLPSQDDPAQFTSAAALTSTALGGSDKAAIEKARQNWLIERKRIATGKIDRLERRLKTPPSDDPSDEQPPKAEDVPRIKDGIKRWNDCLRIIESEQVSSKKVGRR